MNLGDPVAASTLAVTLVTVDEEVTPLTYEGEVGKYGRVFGTHHYSSLFTVERRFS